MGAAAGEHPLRSGGPCGVGYGMQAEGTLPALLAICAGDTMGNCSFFPLLFFLLSPWSRAGCDFGVLSAMRTLSQEAGQRGSPFSRLFLIRASCSVGTNKKV